MVPFQSRVQTLDAVDDSPPRILADADVPFVAEALARYGPVRVLPGAAIAGPDAADALAVAITHAHHLASSRAGITPRP